MVRLHPFTMILFCLVLATMSLTFTHPLYIVSIVGCIVGLLIIVGEGKKVKKTLYYSMYAAVLIIIINPLVYHGGANVLYESSDFFMIGKLKITLEALAYGMNMALKLICIFFVFSFYEAMTFADDQFSFFSKYAHQLTLTFSMSINMIHGLKIEISRVRDVMILRGAKLGDKNLIKRIKAYVPIIKVVFISALEGALDRSEALYVRNYGQTKRTCYNKLRIQYIDCCIHTVSIFLIFFLGYSLYKHIGFVNFYESLEMLGDQTLMGLCYMDSALLMGMFLIGGYKKWKFLKYKI